MHYCLPIGRFIKNFTMSVQFSYVAVCVPLFAAVEFSKPLSSNRRRSFRCNSQAARHSRTSWWNSWMMRHVLRGWWRWWRRFAVQNSLQIASTATDVGNVKKKVFKKRYKGFLDEKYTYMVPTVSGIQGKIRWSGKVTEFISIRLRCKS